MVDLHKLSLVRCLSADTRTQPNQNYRKTRQNRKSLPSFAGRRIASDDINPQQAADCGQTHEIRENTTYEKASATNHRALWPRQLHCRTTWFSPLVPRRSETPGRVDKAR